MIVRENASGLGFVGCQHRKYLLHVVVFFIFSITFGKKRDVINESQGINLLSHEGNGQTGHRMKWFLLIRQRISCLSLL